MFMENNAFPFITLERMLAFWRKDLDKFQSKDFIFGLISFEVLNYSLVIVSEIIMLLIVSRNALLKKKLSREWKEFEAKL